MCRVVCTAARKGSFFFLPKQKRFESGTKVWATAGLKLECCNSERYKSLQGQDLASLFFLCACNHCGPPFSDLLLLQASHRVLTEGEPLALRCHGWKNKQVYNVIFSRNGEAFHFSRGSEVNILKTNLSHNGIYHCSGMGRNYHRYTSAGMAVTVKGIRSR